MNYGAIIGPLLPEIFLVLLGIGILLADAFGRVENRRDLGMLAGFLVGVAFLFSFRLEPIEGALFHGLFKLDAYAIFMKQIFLLSTAVVLVMCAEFSKRMESGVPELYALVLFCATGMSLTASANDFVLLFVALELVTITFYILASFLRREMASLEAGTKYLILGALSSGFTLYGIAYVFGLSGTTNFDQLRAYLEGAGEISSAFKFGMLLVLTGLGFKIAAFPFHIWVPDVYQGAPTPVTGFLAVGSKAAGFALLLRLLYSGLLPVQTTWVGVIMVLSALSLIYGNLGALPQRNLKRLLAYSSIGHAGYLLMGVSAVNELGAGAVLFYLAQYAITNLCAFLAIIAITNETGTDDVSGYAGLGQRSPILGLALFLSLASLAGLPPLSGFFGKFQLFAAVIEQAADNHHYYWLAGVGLVAVVVSLYFYFNVVKAIYLEKPINSAPISATMPVRLVLVLCMLAMLGFGIFQRPLVEAAVTAAAVFGLE